MVSCVTIAIVRNSSLGHWIKTLGDWVKTSAGSKWNMSITICIRISIAKISSISFSVRFWLSRSLAIMISSIAKTIVRNYPLCYGIKTLSDGVKTSAGSKWNMSISISIRVSVTKISSISIGFG